MENLRDVFLKKLNFIVRMTLCYGKYCIFEDWWMVAVPSGSVGDTRGKTHGAGTSFQMKRLDKMFAVEYERELSKNKIKVTQVRNEIRFEIELR